MKRIIFLLSLVLAFAGSFVALAWGDTGSPVAVASLPIVPFVVGAVQGGFYGYLGYRIDLIKNPSEKFNSRQLVATVILGAVIGSFLPVTSPTDLAGLANDTILGFTNFGAIYFVQKGLTILEALKKSSTPV